jgi:hypothetical protein
MLSVCPLGMEIQLIFQYLFLQRLPQTLRTLLGEQECPCSDIHALVALADRLWASHNPQRHEVMAVQEPADEQQVAAVQPQKKAFKMKTGGGGSSGNGSILSHTEQAQAGSGLCFNHFCMEPLPGVAQSPAAGRETRAPGQLNAIAPGLLVYDQLTGWHFLVDTGAAFCILPHQSSEPATGHGLVGPNGSAIRC